MIYGCEECGSTTKRHDCDADLCWREGCILPLNHRGKHEFAGLDALA